MEITLNKAYEAGRRALNAAGYADGAIDARVLLCHVLGVDKEYYYAHSSDRFLTDKEWEKYQNLVKLRLARLPVAYITGHREFMSLDFYIDRSVLIPRPATEKLTELGLDFLKDVNNPTAADICTGSGNIAISLAFYNPMVKICATDISGEAIRTAQKNLNKIDGENPNKNIRRRVTFLQGNLTDPIPTEFRGKLDLILSNPPYVEEEEWSHLMDGVRLYEPKSALVPPEEPKIFYKKLTEKSLIYLAPGGALMFEIGARQGNMVKKIFIDAGLSEVEVYQDLEGFDRVVKGINQGYKFLKLET